MMSNKKPFNSFPNVPPDVDLETTEILKKCITAHRLLGNLNGICSRLPNVNILLNNLVLNEAKDSSEIENIITTLDDLYIGNISKEKVNAYTKEVLNYKEALFHGFSLVREKNIISTNVISQIQEKIEKNNAGIRKNPGTKLVNDTTGEIIYGPPEGENNIRDLLSNLENYINLDDNTDSLIKLAVMHYQFESIHPFYDGNGRTGRILNILFLIQKNILNYPILFLSHYFIKNKQDYYKLLQEVRSQGNWTQWVSYILDAIISTAQATMRIIQSISDDFESTLELARTKMPSRGFSKELIETIYFQPYTKIDALVKHLKIERRTASKYLKELEKIGILRSEKHWKENIYINKSLFEILKTSMI